MVNKNLFIVVLIVILLAGGIFVFSKISKKTAPENVDKNENLPSDTSDYFVADIPANSELTKPELEIPASPSAEREKLRLFKISATRTGFNPENITVNKGDLVQIQINALDGDYDFSLPWIGIYQFIKKGEQKRVSFQVTDKGTLFFECKNFCPAGSIIKGSIVVLP